MERCPWSNSEAGLAPAQHLTPREWWGNLDQELKDKWGPVLRPLTTQQREEFQDERRAIAATLDDSAPISFRMAAGQQAESRLYEKWRKIARKAEIKAKKEGAKNG